MTSEEVRDYVGKYLSDHIDLSAFEDWFVGAMAASSEDDEILANIHLAIAEFDKGHISEADLRNELGMLVFSQTIVSNSNGGPSQIADSTTAFHANEEVLVA